MQYTRRQFIKKLSAGALMMGAPSLLTSCGGITRNDLKSVKSSNGYIFGLDDTDINILRYASLAPSALNVQPWFVRIVDQQRHWVIGSDPRRRLPRLDPDNREILLSIGAFMENLSVAALAMGFHTDFKVIAKTPFDPDLVRVSFEKTSKTNYPLQRLTMRRTVKKNYLQKELSSDTVKAFSDPLNEYFHYSPRGTTHANCIQAGIIEQFRVQLQRDLAQKEICSWIRLTDDDAKKHCDGLTLEGMEIGGIPGWYLRHFAEPPDFMKPGYREKSLDYITSLADQGAGWIVITGDGNDVSSLLETGRKFERMALMAREHQVGIHPMSQYLEEKTGTDKIKESHKKDFIPQFILRVGYINEYPPSVSLRRPVTWFLRT
jgi:nitroreductase